MTVTFSIDNDRILTGTQQLTLDETALLQTTLDANGGLNDVNGGLNDVDDDVGAAYDSTNNTLTSAALDPAFITFISNLFPADAAEDTALSFLAGGRAASSSDTFIQVTASAGETVQNLSFSISPSAPTGLIPGMTTLAGEPLYFHIAADTDFATVTTSADPGGRIVAAFYLDEADDHLSAQVQMVTFEPIKHPLTTDPDDALSFTDVLQVSAAGSTNFTFNNLPSGNFLYAAFGNTTSALLITGDNLSVDHNSGGSKFGEVIKNSSDTVNTSQAAPGTQATIGVNSQHFVAGGSGQNLTDGSIADFTFVTGFVPLVGSAVPAVGTNVQKIDYGGYINTTGAGIDISQLTGGNPHADLRISLWEADANLATPALEPEEGFSYIDNGANGVGSGTNPVDDDTALHDDAKITVGQVKVTHLGTVLTFNATGTQSGVTVTFGVGADANVFTVTGLAGLDSVDWIAANGDTFNRAKIQALSTTSAFDLGGVHITQGSTSSVGVGSHLFVDDDGPTAAIVQGATVAHDETAGIDADANDTTAAAVVALFGGVSNLSTDLSPAGYAQNATAVVSSTGSSFGADQEGGTTAFSLDVSAAGVDSGLDTTNGTNIFLFKEGNLVVGRIGADAVAAATGQAAFAVAINSTSGVVSVAQYASLKHPTGGASHDEAINITEGALLAVVKVTDGDGDTATNSTGIGDAVQFQDDGPTAAIVQGATVAHDETAGIDADANDTTAAAVVALFGGVSNLSTDLSPAGYAQNATAVVSSTGSSFGADQEGGTTAFSLDVSAAGVDSGLDTTNGTNIFLFKEGNLVVGRIGADAVAAATGQAAFAVAINSTSGVVSVAQYASLKHPTGGASHDEAINITEGALLAVVKVTDGDGDTATNSTGIGDAVQFQDDGPTAAIVQGATVAHDETAGIDADANDTTAAAVVALFGGVSNLSTDLSPAGYAQNATAVVSSTGSSFGADQEGGTTAFSLDVSAAGVDSGLDTTNGTNIFLFKEGNLVVGRIGADAVAAATGQAAFAVAINSTSGVVSVAQYASLKHPTGGASHDEAINITEGALLAVVKVTDGDGDTATNSTGIGDAVQFQDDGPTAAIVQGATVAHDETAGIDADANDTTAAAVVALFGGVSNLSTDLSPAGYAQNATAVVSSTGSSFGADQEGGTTAFSLDVSAAGVDSGLDTTNGTNIFLFKEGNLVVGRIGADAVAAATGQAAFAVAINSTSGVVSVAQYASLKHPTGGASHDEAINITEGALLAVVKVTDGDGDTATNSTGIGDAVQFQDDGPTAAIVQGATVAHDETAGIDADANDTTAAAVVALFGGVSNLSTDLSPAGYAQNATAVVSSTGSSFGADQEGGTTAFSLDVSAAGVDSGLDTTNGTNIFLFKEGNLVVGRIGADAVAAATGQAAFAVAINSTSGVVSVAQYASLKHPTGGASHDEAINITEGALLAVVKVTDGDGDTATNSTGIGDAVQFQDDGPTAAIVQGATVAHDETAGIDADANDTTAAAVVALFGGVSNLSTDLSPAGYAQNATAVVSSTGSSFGADQEGGTTAFSLDVSAAGVDSGLDTTNGTNIFLFKEGNLVVGRIGADAVAAATGQAAFAVAINSTSGVVSVAQYASLKHPTGGASHDEAINITEGALLAVVKVTDGDGDTATNSTGIGDAVQFQDDGPSILANGTATALQLDESFIPIVGSTPDISKTSKTGDFAGLFTPTYGEDGAGGVGGYTLGVKTANADSGLIDSKSGSAVLLSIEAATGDVLGSTGANGTGNIDFRIHASSDGTVTFTEFRAVKEGTGEVGDISESASMAADLITLSATATDKDGDTSSAASANIGNLFKLLDDGSAISGVDNKVVDSHAGQSVTDAFLSPDGADGAKVTISGAANITGLFKVFNADNTSVTYFADAAHLDPVYKLTVADESYKFDVLKTLTSPPESLNFSAIKSGSPVEVLNVGTSGGHTIHFDGLLFNSAFGTVPGGIGEKTKAALISNGDLDLNNSNDANPGDDLNPDNIGFGVKNGQASQMNHNEGFFFNEDSGLNLANLGFDVAGIGNLNSIRMEVWLFNANDELIDYSNSIVSGLKQANQHVTASDLGNNITGTAHDVAGEAFSTGFVRFSFDNADPNAGVRIINFTTQVETQGHDQEIQFQLTNTDADSDTAVSDKFTVLVDNPNTTVTDHWLL